MKFKKYCLSIMLLASWIVYKPESKASLITQYIEGQASISGQLPVLRAGDTVKLTYWEDKVFDESSHELFPEKNLFSIVDKDGSFHFEVPMLTPMVYFLLDPIKNETNTKETSKLLLRNHLLEVGDSLYITLDHLGIRFTGKGAGKINCIRDIDRLLNPMSGVILNGDTATLVKRFQEMIEYDKSAKSILESYADELSPFSQKVLTADVLGRSFYLRYYVTYMSYRTISTKAEAILEFYRKNLRDSSFPNFEHISRHVLGMSMYFSSLILVKSQLEAEYQRRVVDKESGKEGTDATTMVFEKLSRLPKGMLRDKAIAMFCYDRAKRGRDEVERNILYLSKALELVENNNIRLVLQEYLNRYQGDFAKGKEVLNFNMENIDGNKVRLFDYKRKVVFVDIWFTGCGACKLVAKAMREKVEPYFKNRDDVVFLSISIDKDRELWKNSIAKHADYHSGDKTIYLRTLNGQDDPFIKKYVTSGYPTLMVIDREGKMYDFSAQRPDGGKEKLLIDQINAALKAL